MNPIQVSLGDGRGLPYGAREEFFNGKETRLVWLVSAADEAAVQFTAKRRFGALGVQVNSSGVGTGYFRLRLYRWTGSLEITLAGTPLYSEDFQNVSGQMDIIMQFPALEKGEYAWLLTNPAGKVGIGVRPQVDSTHPAQAYFNGQPLEGAYISWVVEVK